MSDQSQPAQSLLYDSFEFCFDESRRFVVEVDDPVLDGWKITKRKTILEVCSVCYYV